MPTSKMKREETVRQQARRLQLSIKEVRRRRQGYPARQQAPVDWEKLDALGRMKN